jgi:hypothetical protein
MQKPRRGFVHSGLSRTVLKKVLVPANTDAATLAAVSLVEALIRVLSERGLLSEDDLDELLSEAKEGHDDPAIRRIIDAVGTSAGRHRERSE